MELSQWIVAGHAYWQGKPSSFLILTYLCTPGTSNAPFWLCQIFVTESHAVSKIWMVIYLKTIIKTSSMKEKSPFFPHLHETGCFFTSSRFRNGTWQCIPHVHEGYPQFPWKSRMLVCSPQPLASPAQRCSIEDNVQNIIFSFSNLSFSSMSGAYSNRPAILHWTFLFNKRTTIEECNKCFIQTVCDSPGCWQSAKGLQMR